MKEYFLKTVFAIAVGEALFATHAKTRWIGITAAGITGLLLALEEANEKKEEENSTTQNV